MVHIRECMRRWLPFVIMAASLGVSPAQDVASPDAADLDLDLVKLKSGPKGRQREAMRKVLLLVHLKQKETWLAESTGDEAVHLAAEISFRQKPAQRRRGFGAVITQALADRGADEGAMLSALQVFAHNEPAVRLYRGLGYADHHRYRYQYERQGSHGSA